MKELNELVELAKEFDASTTVEAAMTIKSKFKATVTCETILAIADAFLALEQRAEAAEAKLAELESNPLIDHLEKCSAIVSAWPEWKKQGADASKFTRPAPDADLAALVPEKASMADYCENVRSGEIDPEEAGIAMWDACRAEMLRKN